jgi:hypothetical protein
LGGFGISRYNTDHQLSIIAKQSGVELLDNTKVSDASMMDTGFGSLLAQEDILRFIVAEHSEKEATWM